MSWSDIEFVAFQVLLYGIGAWLGVLGIPRLWGLMTRRYKWRKMQTALEEARHQNWATGQMVGMGRSPNGGQVEPGLTLEEIENALVKSREEGLGPRQRVDMVEELKSQHRMRAVKPATDND